MHVGNVIIIKWFLLSICKVLENRSKQDEERMDQLTAQLKEARLIAEDADTKSDEISRKLAFVEDELEAAEERVKSSEALVSHDSLNIEAVCVLFCRILSLIYSRFI